MIGGPKSVMGWFLHYYFRICWTFLSPVILIVVFVAYLYVTATSTLGYDAWVNGEIEENVPYPWYGTMVVVLLIVLPLICIPGYWTIKAIITKVRGDENDGILCERPWTIRNIMFWKNSYDRDGNLK